MGNQAESKRNPSLFIRFPLRSLRPMESVFFKSFLFRQIPPISLAKEPLSGSLPVLYLSCRLP
jgi:hypothetical protein